MNINSNHRILLRLLVCVALFLGVSVQAVAYSGSLTINKGTIKNGVWTYEDPTIGMTVTIDNASYIYQSSGDSGFGHLKMKSQNNTTTITFRFTDKNFRMKALHYMSYAKTKKKILFKTYDWTVFRSLSCDWDLTNGGDHWPSSCRTVTDNYVQYTTTGNIDEIWLQDIELKYDISGDINENLLKSVTKVYTGASQRLYETSSSYSYSPYVFWGTNLRYTPRFGGTMNVNFDASEGYTPNGEAKDPGLYPIRYSYEIFSFGSFSDHGQAPRGYWVYYIYPTGWYDTINSEIEGLPLDDVVAPTAKKLVYTGEAQPLVTAATSANGTGLYKVYETTNTWSDAVPTETDAGTYPVYWYMKANSNIYKDYGGADAFYGPVNVTIERAPITDYAAPTGLTLTYDTEEHQLYSGGTATGGNIIYRIGTDGLWRSDCKMTDAGTYTVYWYIKGDNNHQDMGSETVPAGHFETTIRKADYNMKGVTWSQTEFTYDGRTDYAQQGIGVQDLPSGDLQVSYSCADGGTAVDAGKYTVTARFTTTSPNYNAPDDLSTTLTVLPYNLGGAYIATPIAPQDYTGEALQPVADGMPVLKIANSEGIEIPATAYQATYLDNVNVGQNTATAILTATDPNYTGSLSLSFTIQKTVLQVKTSDQAIVYGETISSDKSHAVLLDANGNAIGADGPQLTAVTLSPAEHYGIGTHEQAIQATDVHIETKVGDDLVDVTDNYTIQSPAALRGTLTISAKAGDGFTVSGLQAEYEGDGVSAVEPHTLVSPEVAIFDGTTKLQKGTDYTVTYDDNVSAGTATMKVTFVGNYSGSLSRTFIIYYRAETYSRKAAPQYNYCTYYHASENLQADANAQVFYCTLTDDKQDVLLTEVADRVVNAGVPVMLRTPSTVDAVKLYAWSGAAAVNSGENALTGVAASAAGTEVALGDKVYIFDGESFVWAVDGELVNHRAYIDGSAGGHSLNARRLSIVYGDNNATGISAVDTEAAPEQWFDLQGRRIEKPTRKGLYILNGKKVVVK